MTNSQGMDLKDLIEAVNSIDPLQWSGEVTEMVGLLIESRGPAAAVGSFCEVLTASGKVVRTQVVGFRNGRVLSIPLEETDGIQLGDRVVARDEDSRLGVGPDLLGRVLDGFGEPLDEGPRLQPATWYNLFATPPNPLSREPVTEPLVTGIRVIDGLLTCGKGQRIGLFGGSGVGKSTLLGTMSRQNGADVTVIALIGERNREVRAFLDHELGPEGRKKSVVVVATSDRPAPLRIRACYVALAVAEYFRDQGKSVLLVMDSVTRLAMAQREIGLAAGEPPSQKGYTPSVFNLLPKIFERAGNFANGSITGFFTVLVEGDDFNEPICDAVRGILDGHVVLSRSLGSAGHYPAVDVLQSVSRVMPQIVAPNHLKASQKVREAMACYERSADLIQLGAYVAGTNPQLDNAVRNHDRVMDFLRQSSGVKAPITETLDSLAGIATSLGLESNR
ncbi:MAG: FliI/YscN family ATPase [Bryobacteraceae bacterium]|nr:FliI/YscN family ATPase [Bryobacteraceae bacterium]